MCDSNEIDSEFEKNLRTLFKFKLESLRNKFYHKQYTRKAINRNVFVDIV